MRDDIAPPAGGTPPPDAAPSDAPPTRAPSDAEFRLLADNLPTLAWIADETGYITWYNRRWHEYCGTTPAEMEGWGWQSVHDPAVLPDVMARWTASISSGESFEMTFPLRGADGLFRPFLTRIAPVRDEADRIVRWVGTNVDVSAQVALEEARRSAESRARDVLDSMGEGFLVLGPDFRIQDINAEGLRIDGRPREQIVGRHLLDVWPESTELPTWPLYQRAMAGRRPHTLEYRHQSEVHDVWLEVRVYPADPGIAIFYRDITERRRAEIALEESGRAQEAMRERQDAILGQLEEGVIVTDAAGRITFVNEAAERLHGTKALDVAPDDYTETYHLLTLDGRPHPVEALPLARAVRNREIVTDARWRIRRPDGTEVIAIGSAKPLLVDGEVAGAVLTLRDDTERARHEADLRAAEERLRLATRATNDAIWDWSFADDRVLWSEALGEAYGHRPDGFATSGDWWLERIHPDDRERVSRGIHAVIDGDGINWTDEYCFRRADGSYADVLDRGAVVRDGEGRATRMIGAMLDLSSRKRAEAALREREERLRMVVDGAADYAILTMDPERRITSWSAGAERAFGWTEVEALGRPADDLFTPEDRAAGQPEREVEAALRDGVGEDVREHLRADGSRVFMNGVVRPLPPDGSGRPRGFIKIARDETDRREAEQKLRASEDRLRLATQAAEIGTFDYDPISGRLEWDDRTRALFGVTPGVPISYEGTFERALHPDDRADADVAVQRALDPAGDGRYEVEYRTIGIEDGVERWVSATGQVHFDKGRPVRFVGTIRDVTERMHAADALKASEERLEAITDSVDQMIWSTRPDGYHDYYNQRWYEFTGVPEGSTDGEAWDGMFHPEDQQRAWARWRQSLETGEPYEIEYRLRHRSGTYRWVIGRARATRDADGRITRWFGTCTDIQDLKESQARLEEERRTLETINRTGAALAGELEPERLIQMVTDAGRELTGADYAAFFYSSVEEENDFALYTLSGARREDFEWMGRPRVTSIFHGTFVDRKVIRSDDIATDPRYGQMAPHHGTPTGHLPVRSYLGVPVIGRSGEVIGAMLFAHGEPGRFTARHERLVVGVAAQAAIAIDNARLLKSAQAELAERTRAEEALRELNATLEARIAEAIAEREQAEAQLRQAQKMEAVGQLTGGIAHDFNNLLTVVMGNIDMGRRALEGGDDGIARTRRALDNAQRGAERAAALTQRLLAFARRQPLLPKPINVDRLVAGMQDLLARALGETVQLEVVTAPGLWRVEADPNQLESAILNLAVNARDAMPEGGRLTIETANAQLEDSYSAAHAEVAPGQYVLTAISDTGEGMSRETLEHVFEPFFTTKEVGKGTGLGLSQVYGFVKQSGGHVKIYSESGQGTTVKIYLPRLLSGVVADDPSPETEAERASARETVLVVEDDPDVRQYSAESLRELGYRVLEAEDGPAALRVLERAAAPVDLLFTDVVMPAMSGRELADAARERQPELKVLFTSGYTRNAITRDGRLEPGTAMIAKPFSFHALARKLRDVLDTGKSGRVLVISGGARARGADALSQAGYVVDWAADGVEAFGRVRAGVGMFDAVILDGGADMAAAVRLYGQLRAVRENLPMLILGDDVNGARLRLQADRCAAVRPADTPDGELAAALATLGVACAEAYANTGHES